MQHCAHESGALLAATAPEKAAGDATSQARRRPQSQRTSAGSGSMYGVERYGRRGQRSEADLRWRRARRASGRAAKSSETSSGAQTTAASDSASPVKRAASSNVHRAQKTAQNGRRQRQCSGNRKTPARHRRTIADGIDDVVAERGGRCRVQARGAKRDAETSEAERQQPAQRERQRRRAAAKPA